MKKCVQCGSTELNEVKTEDVLTVAGRTFTRTIPARRCEQCEEVSYHGNDLGAMELDIAQELAREGPVAGEALRFMRTAMGLPSGELASLLGVTPETVSRWEHGKLTFDRRTFALVGLMVLDHIEGRSMVADFLRGLDAGRAA